MSAPARAAAVVCLTSRSANETRDLAATLARAARAGDRIGLHGPLGAGKTQFAKGFAVGLGVSEVVLSPTFTLMAEYAGRLPLFHVDLFRLADDVAAEAYAAGLLDERESAGVTLIEWAERLGPANEPHRLDVSLAEAGEAMRVITLAARGRRYARYLAVARSWTAPVLAAMASGGGR
jgi:tRNA threonylcarbamoyladenosine biosynthesis protein TsaE